MTKLTRESIFYGVGSLIIVIAFWAIKSNFWNNTHGSTQGSFDPPATIREIQQLRELLTVKYSIQKVVGLREEKIPFGEESILLLVQATVLAGLDLSAMTDEDIQFQSTNGVTVKLPPAKIMHIYLDDRETKVWDRSKTWWTPWVSYNPELEQNARLSAREAAQSAAIEMGILVDAQQNAEAAIRELLRFQGIESIKFLPNAE